MADNTDNLVLEHLRAIRKTVDDTRFDVKDLKRRMASARPSSGCRSASGAVSISSMSDEHR